MYITTTPTSLIIQEVQSESEQLREKEQEILQEEYQKSVEEFQSEKKKFQEQHPDRAKQEELDAEDLVRHSD